MKEKFKRFANLEKQRQYLNMRQAQEKEIETIENAQKMQFTEFCSAWDNYMNEYEMAAYESIEKLKERHIKEITELHEKVKREFQIKMKASKQLLDLRRQEKTFFTLKEYKKAEECKLLADQQEEVEMSYKEEELLDEIAKQERNLRHKQY